MQTRVNYLQASFFSFLIHAALFLYLIGFFYSEKQLRPILSKAVIVSIIVEEISAKQTKELKTLKPNLEEVKPDLASINTNNISDVPKISSQGSITESSRSYKPRI